MKSLLASTSVMELIAAPKEIIAFLPSLTIGDAIDVMGHYEIFSAPVITREGTRASLPACLSRARLGRVLAEGRAAFFLLSPAALPGCCVGQVDYLDLLCKLVQLTSDSSDSQV